VVRLQLYRAHNPISQLASPTMVLPQHLLALIKTSEDVAIVVDNAKRPVSSVTEAYRTKNDVSRPLQPTVSMDTLPVLPRSRTNQTEPIPPLCSARKTKISSRKKVKRCSAKSLSKKLNAARIKSISRWDSGSIVSEDSSLSSTSPEQQQTLSDLATQKFHSRPTLGRTHSMDKTNHRSALPLRLPRRRESVQGLDTAAMIDEVLGELALMDSEDEDLGTEDTSTQSRQLPAPSC
jgi:hypothetical protein